MKKSFIVLALGTLSLVTNATDTLQAPNLGVPATVHYSPQSLELMMEGSEALHLPISTEAGRQGLGPAAQQMLLDALAMDAEQLAAAIGADTGQLGTAIVARAKQANELVFINQAQDPAAEPGGVPVANDEESAGLGWKLWAILTAVLVLAIAGTIYFTKKNKKETVNKHPKQGPSVNEKAMANAKSTDKATKIGDLRATIKQLQAELQEKDKANTALQEQLKASKAQNKDLSTNLQSWAQQLRAALTRYINPLHTALEQGDKATAIGKALQAAIQLGSMAKIANKSSEAYDGANAHYLLQGQEPAASYPTIDAGTAKDKIPKHVKTLVEILKENGASWDGTIVKDFKIGRL